MKGFITITITVKEIGNKSLNQINCCCCSQRSSQLGIPNDPHLWTTAQVAFLFFSFLFSFLSLFFSAQAAFCKKNSSTLFCCKVSSWLQWAAQEFQLLSDSVSGFIQNFRVSGPDLCNYSRHHFLSRFSIKSCLIGKLCWISYHLLKSGLLYLLVMFSGSTCSC